MVGGLRSVRSPHYCAGSERWGPEAAGSQEVDFGQEVDFQGRKGSLDLRAVPVLVLGRWWTAHSWRGEKEQPAVVWAQGRLGFTTAADSLVISLNSTRYSLQFE